MQYGWKRAASQQNNNFIFSSLLLCNTFRLVNSIHPAIELSITKKTNPSPQFFPVPTLRPALASPFSSSINSLASPMEVDVVAPRTCTHVSGSIELLDVALLSKSACGLSSKI
ncbi:hypothetical protein K432DRAFT_173048 [Lepidopterella palustris CBS 459.81]|uniref:Uncharacterized protein n=1 Tax=Lepidopterella palustris CBS 459.81 TaxID=1314670 RepID=A0A8E2E1D8_9PEZI|nr:hypothetical protein K432DRAFT_173048 [Lepidopterella palustris CBS 459.81]